MKQSLLTAVVLTSLSAPVAAQSTDWEYAATLYGWVPGLGVSVPTASGQLDIDVSGKDLISNLDMAFMAAFEASSGQWMVLGDLFYSDISAGKSTPFGLLHGEATVTTKLTLASGYIGYRVQDTSSVAIDLVGGFRAFDVDLTVGLTPGLSPAISTQSQASWANPVVGARAIVNLDDTWFVTGFFDVGGTGSDDNTWQLLGSVGYRFNDRWSTQLGYRHMEFEHVIGGNDTTMALSGPFIAVTARF